jgi:outer membrane protein assembly factor BamB
VTDGRHVFVYYKSGDLACLDFSGRIVWQKNLQQEYGEDTLWWDLGTSPVLTKDAVVVACMQSGPSYVAAFNKQSGGEVWKVDRTFDVPQENDNSYTTPVVVESDGRELVVAAGADHVTAHHAATGEEVWQAGGLNPEGDAMQRSIASPVATSDAVIVSYGRGSILASFSFDGSLNWLKQGKWSDVPTPAFSDGGIYICGDRGDVSRIDPSSGEIDWSTNVGRGREVFSSSPVVAGGFVYVTREDGTTFVVDSREHHEVVAANELGEPIFATPVFVDGRILIRTAAHLWCIGE